MRTTLVVRRSLPRALALLAAVALGCTESHPTEPDAVRPAFGKASSTGPTVTATRGVIASRSRSSGLDLIRARPPTGNSTGCRTRVYTLTAHAL